MAMVAQYIRLLRITGIAAWCTLLTALIFALRAGAAPVLWPRSYLWLVLWLAFGAVFLACTTRVRKTSAVYITLLATESVIALIMSWLQPNSYEGFLLIIIAWQLALHVPQKIAAWWVVLQTACLIIIISPSSPRGWVLAYAGTCFAFKTFSYVVVVFARREADARSHQESVNAELIATRQLLVETSRSRERLRISQELHDALGHQLTALNIHLEIALNQPRPEEVEAHIRKAQLVAKAMLSDVRDVVGTLREFDENGDLFRAIHSLTRSLPNLEVHLSADKDLPPIRGEHAHTLLRCVQEVITNTLKHARAENLWVCISGLDGVLQIETWDDGRGAGHDFTLGIGLSGMRERFEQLGGSVKIAARNGNGFSLHGQLPVLPAQVSA
jgi:signal transduction histidine kinase